MYAYSVVSYFLVNYMVLIFAPSRFAEARLKRNGQKKLLRYDLLF